MIFFLVDPSGDLHGLVDRRRVDPVMSPARSDARSGPAVLPPPPRHGERSPVGSLFHLAVMRLGGSRPSRLWWLSFAAGGELGNIQACISSRQGFLSPPSEGGLGHTSGTPLRCRRPRAALRRGCSRSVVQRPFSRSSGLMIARSSARIVRSGCVTIAKFALGHGDGLQRPGSARPKRSASMRA